MADIGALHIKHITYRNPRKQERRRAQILTRTLREIDDLRHEMPLEILSQSAQSSTIDTTVDSVGFSKTGKATHQDTTYENPVSVSEARFLSDLLGYTVAEGIIVNESYSIGQAMRIQSALSKANSGLRLPDIMQSGVFAFDETGKLYFLTNSALTRMNASDTLTPSELSGLLKEGDYIQRQAPNQAGFTYVSPQGGVDSLRTVRLRTGDDIRSAGERIRMNLSLDEPILSNAFSSVYRDNPMRSSHAHEHATTTYLSR